MAKIINSMLMLLLILTLFTVPVFAKSNHINSKVAEPTASSASGNYYGEQKVVLNSTSPGAKIYYTTDGSIPTDKSTLFIEAIRVNNDSIIKAIAIRGKVKSKGSTVKNKKHQSDVAEFTYTFETRGSIAEKFLEFTYKSMPYRLYVPENYDPNTSYPLVLFLHGGGERGNDNEKHLMANDGAVIWAAPENQAKHPSFILAPQSRNVPDGGFTITRDVNNIVNLSRVFEVSEDLKMAYEVLQHVRGEYNIDPNRLYSTGVSQGGFGTFNMNMEHPDTFAAMVPIAGGADPAKAHLIKHVPIWAFHAKDDSVIPVSYSRNIIDAIESDGGEPIYTEYKSEMNYDHASWIPAYENEKMIEWVFQQVKSSN
ncbi:chitobiase/beta-hexosaminidase C-terminal domain-containing protein [Peribacillus simplex]|uniref:chitobiase/beta-hexosaminidase C-terminal domain-containing protein n=1 Tax=Peribacillus simplex TaxID=1478 RepID=UPI003D293576